MPYLIDRATSGYLWIDQVCINQEDPDERTMQVLLMREIYKKAAIVRVWLTKDTERLTKAVYIAQLWESSRPRTEKKGEPLVWLDRRGTWNGG